MRTAQVAKKILKTALLKAKTKTALVVATFVEATAAEKKCRCKHEHSDTNSQKALSTFEHDNSCQF